MEARVLNTERRGINAHVGGPRLAPTLSEGPKVSIVMPTYRRASAITRGIQSLRRQTLSDFELLVRDDGSADDGTMEAVASAACGDSRIRYHRNGQRLGIPENINDGIAATTGRYVVVCHDHDEYRQDYLATLANLLDGNPSAVYAHCAVEQLDSDGVSRGAVFVGPWPETIAGGEWLRVQLASFSCPVTALTLVRRSAYEDAGLYDPKYGFFADVEMWMRLSTYGDIAYSNQPMLRLWGREPGHEATMDPWPQIVAILSMHREYVMSTFAGIEQSLRRVQLAVRSEKWVLRTLASRIRHSARPLVSQRHALARQAGPLGRALVTLLG